MSERPPASASYRDPSEPVDRRVEDLIDRMTLPEKVGQLLVSPSVGSAEDVEREVLARIDEYHLGQVSPFGREHAPSDPERIVELVNAIQRHAVEETRLGIPLLVIANAVHGNAYVDGATIFPHNLGLAAARSTKLVTERGRVTAAELTATGAHQNYGPVCDVGREPRWGRTFETFGESAFLCGELGAAAVRGLQGEGIEHEGSVLATAKHFPAYGEPVGGEDAGVNELSSYAFDRFHRPAFEAPVAAGVEAVMPCYNSIDGEPVHGSSRLLDDLLRGELGFEGFVVSDYHGVDHLHEAHRTAPSLSAALARSANAGMDAYLDGEVCEAYAERLRTLVVDGDIPEERLDESVGRILSAKVRLGLFEDPYADPALARTSLGSEDHRAVALECARESIVLAQNENDVLPLDPLPERVFVGGPCADDLDALAGGWSAAGIDSGDGVTIREGIEAMVGDETIPEAGAGEATNVRYERGSGLRTADPAAIERARNAAAAADVAILAVGESQYIHEFGLAPASGATCEFPTRAQLTLPESQRDLVRAVTDTGTPTVIVLVAGRPLATAEAAERADGVLVAFYPGTQGGQAIADVLTGTHNPSGVLPISIPRSVGQLPQRFNHLRHPTPIGPDEHPDSYDPLFPFGHGLSYTTFAYDDLTASEASIGPTDAIEVSVTVTNEGERAGTAVLDVYVSDRYSSRVPPVRELRGWTRVGLEPGESETATITIDAADLAVPQTGGTRRVEAGTFDVHVAGEMVSFEVE